MLDLAPIRARLRRRVLLATGPDTLAADVHELLNEVEDTREMLRGVLSLWDSTCPTTRAAARAQIERALGERP
jgi:hypothetical protein